MSTTAHELQILVAREIFIPEVSSYISAILSQKISAAATADDFIRKIATSIQGLVVARAQLYIRYET